VSRTGRTEYQLLLMKASDSSRNVKFLGNNFGCVLSNLTNNNYTCQLVVHGSGSLVNKYHKDCCNGYFNSSAFILT